MSLRLTPDVLRAAYELLNVTRPFDKWNLPDDVEFKVGRTKRDYGWFVGQGDRVMICASHGAVGHLLTLLATMAHEMVHMHQFRTGMPVNHGPAFQKLSAQVCRWHRDFDPKSF